MNSEDLARYIETTNGITKPWLLVQLRLQKLKEQYPSLLTTEEYYQELEALQQDLMKLGAWWEGREKEVFGDGDIS